MNCNYDIGANDIHQDPYSPRTSIELPPIHLHSDITSDPYSNHRPRDFLPSLLANSPPGRSSTLPPLQRPLGPTRPRKHSVTKKGREGGHKKKPSRGSAADWLRRIQNEERRPGNDRKALSAEPSADYGKRWADLIDAADQAASIAGDLDEERTPVSQAIYNSPGVCHIYTNSFRCRCRNHQFRSKGRGAQYHLFLNSSTRAAITRHRLYNKL